MQTHRDILEQNNNKTIAVVVVYLIIYAIIGVLVDIILINANSLESGFHAIFTLQVMPIATISMTVFGVVSVFISLSMYDKLMLYGADYRLIDPASELSHDDKRLYNIVEEMTIAARLGYIPRIYIIDANYMNAFASGFSERSAMVAITSALLQKLNRAEVQAVMAHELSHIRHNDIRLTLVIGVLSNIMLFVVNNFVYFLGQSRQNKGANFAKIILFALQLILPFITLALQSFLSKSREYMADAGAVELMRDNRPMAQALIKIHEDYTQNVTLDSGLEIRRVAYIAEPITKAFNLFGTHPSLEDRLKALGYKG